MRSEVPLLAVSLALEAKASQRELTSRLLADLCGPVLTCGNLESAFDKLLWELPDLVLDTPGAPQVNPCLHRVPWSLSRVNVVSVDLVLMLLLVFVCFTRTQHICLILLVLPASLAVAVGQMRQRCLWSEPKQ